ncbi:MAG TPA: hypothetical protein DIU15_11535, partial [Deltaproteobacteria bacterium]|nr:hypothetical protein [Deltaproteobacteria bacterium]HCP46670.1 hypothetical protein [Deltaproteobacteria bacterium]
ADSSLGQRIISDLPYIWAEVDYSVEEEMAITLRDFMRRRTQLEIRACQAAIDVAEDVGSRMGELLSWTKTERRAQVEDFRSRAAQSMAWRHRWEEPGAQVSPSTSAPTPTFQTRHEPEEQTLPGDSANQQGVALRPDAPVSTAELDEDSDLDETIRA